MSLSQVCANITTKNSGDDALLDKNILEFVNAPWGLGLGCTSDVPPLYPVQRFILKCYYGLPLDNSSNRDIIINDKFNEKELYRFNETEYIKYLYNEGRINRETFEGKGDTSNLILAIGRRSGKCVTGGTLVLTEKGIIPIRNLAEAPEDDLTPLDIGVIQEGKKLSRSTQFYNGGIKDVYKVETNSGYRIEGSANHRIRVMDTSGTIVWRLMSEIRAGDRACLNVGTNLWATTKMDIQKMHTHSGLKSVKLPNILDEDLGNLIGYLVGDGSWTRDVSVEVTVEHHETKEHLHELFYKVFGEYPRFKLDKRTKNTGCLGIHSKDARELLESLGWSKGCGRYNKRVPWSILQSPVEVVCSFLRGVFETDGCIEKGGRITLSSASFDLARDIQTLLLNIGIVSSVRKKYIKKTKRNYAVLAIKGVESRKIFAEKIHFDSMKKNIPLQESILKSTNSKSSTESVPYMKSKLRSLIDSVPKRKPGTVGPGRMVLRSVVGNVVKNSNEDISSYKLEKTIRVAKEINADGKIIQELEETLSLGYFYDTVDTIERSKEQVYDLVVPDGESFVGNGFTNHNTVIASVIIAYETYRLLNKYSPQEYYGIMPEDDIKIVSVSTSKETASELFNKVTGHLQRSEFFRKFRNTPTQKTMSLRSQRDIDKYGDKGRATIHINVAPCSAAGLRGANNIVVVLDEMAFFFADKSGKEVSNSNRDDRAIYNAVTPSVAKFKKPDGTPDGKIIGISSPFTKSGKFFEEYERSFKEGNNDLLMVQSPTWEVDPGLSTQYLRNKYDENPISFRSEFGAQFSDRMAGWIEDESIVRQNVVPGLTYKKRGIDRVPHFLGVDIGLKGDGTAISVGHWVTERVGGALEDFIELDACDIRYSSEEGLEYFTPEMMSDWIASYTNKFYIIKGLLDQYYGMSIVPLLHKAGHKQFEFRSFTESLNSKVYQNLLSHLISGNMRLPEGQGIMTENGVDNDSDLVRELLTLQSEKKSKYIVKVFAPERKDCHDDLSDSFSRMVYLATEFKYKNFGKKITSPVVRKAGSTGRSVLGQERKKAMLNRSSRGGGSYSRSSGPTFNRL